MARTDAPAVREILDTSLDNDSLSAWIDIATELVDDVQNADSSLSSTRLTKLEKLVAAHLASSQDQRHERESGPARSVSYQGDTGEGFTGTKHGQQALALDPTGTLAGSHRPAASLSVPDVKE